MAATSTAKKAPNGPERKTAKLSPQELALADLKTLPLSMGELLDALVANGSRFEGRPSPKSPSLRDLRFEVNLLHAYTLG